MSEKTFFDNLPHQIFAKDITGRYIGCNYTFAKARGNDNASSTIVGHDDTSLEINGSLAKHYQREDQWVMQTGQPLTVCEYAWDKSLDCYIVVHGQLSPMRDTAGKVCGVYGSLLPIAKCDDRHIILLLEPQNICLTWREAQCLHFLLGGWSAREIGKLLHISAKTVEHHWLQARIKFGDLTRSSVIRRLLNHQITRLLPDSYQIKIFGRKID